MSEADALSTFDFSKVGGGGLFVKFEAGKPLTLRVLTTDPVVSQVEYEDDKTGEVTISTKFSFVVYNFTDDKAQILSATPTIARKIGDFHIDPEFGSNIRNIDIRISPTGEKLTRRYDIQVLPKARNLTKEQVAQCQAIKLDEKVEGQRMSFYDPETAQSGLDKARATANALRGEDPVIDDIGEEPVNLDEIPF